MYKIKLLLQISIILLTMSCGDSKISEYELLIQEIDEFVKINIPETPTGIKPEEQLLLNLELEFPEAEPLVSLQALHELPDTLGVNEYFPEIFGEYHSRNFISGVSEKYNLIEALGHLYEKDKKGSFKKFSFQKIIKGKFEPKIKKVDKVYFKNVLTDSSEINAGIKFLSIKASKSSKVELLIKDELAVTLPDENKDLETLGKIKKALGTSAKNVYYSYGATLSSITNKTYSKSAWRPAINASWFTFDRKKYKGQENFSYRSDVHVDLISLDKLLDLDVSNSNANKQTKN